MCGLNYSCSPPAEQVNASWYLQAVDGIQDVNQVMTLNMLITMQWRDWRLAYAELGIGCWQMTTQLPVSQTLAASLNATGSAALAAGVWQCAGGVCGADSMLVDSSGGPNGGAPLGLTPTLTASPTGFLTAFPATGDLQPICTIPVAANSIYPALCNPTLSGATPSGTYMQNVSAALGLPAATNWLLKPTMCQGNGARRLPPSLNMVSMQAQGSGPTGGGGPGGGAAGAPGSTSPVGPSGLPLPTGTSVDWSTIWDPQMEDSINQESPDTVINEEWTVYPDGTVQHQLHLQADYAISGKVFAAFPFDKPMYVATRRPYKMYYDAVNISVVGSGFALPQEMDGWLIREIGVTTCPVHDLAIDDPSDCGMPGAAPCSSMLVMWLAMTRKPNYILQNMLSPITLVTVLAASTYYNDLDAYDSRLTVLATSLLSLMALQGYVSANLPPTEVITFIHYALYTAYALMGWGIGLVIGVSFFLSVDLDQAKKVRPVPLEEVKAAQAEKHSSNHHRMRHNMVRMPKAEGEVRVKPWVMILYYKDALVFRRIKFGTATPEDRAKKLTYFPYSPTGEESLHATLSELSAMPSAFTKLESGVSTPRARSEEYEAAPVYLEAAYCPDRIWLRMFMVELDVFMRVGHLLVYGLVLLGRWVAITSPEPDTFSCADLVSFFANTAPAKF